MNFDSNLRAIEPDQIVGREFNTQPSPLNGGQNEYSGDEDDYRTGGFEEELESMEQEG